MSTTSASAPLLAAGSHDATGSPIDDDDLEHKAKHMPPSHRTHRFSTIGSTRELEVSQCQRCCRLFRRRWRPVLVAAAMVALLSVLGLTRWSNLTFHAWVALGVTAAALVALGAEMTDPPAVFLAAIMLLVVTRTLTLKAAIAGFATPLVFAIAGMYALSRGISDSTLMG